VNVEINEGGMGTASPRGQLTGIIKQGIPFTLNYSSFAEYGFLRWEAALSSAPDTVLGSDKVEFSPADAVETTVTVKINPGGNDRVIIRPLGGLAPVVGSFTPDVANGTVGANRVIRIRFDRAIDPASFLFDNGLPFQGDWRAAYYPESYGDPDNIGGYDNRVYKNILIESNAVLWGLESNNWAPFYYPPELSDDGTILTIALHPDGGNSDYVAVPNQLTVTLNRDIRDTRGISLGRTYSFIMEVAGTTEERNPADADPPYPEILNGSNFVMVKASPPDAFHPDGRIWPGAKIFEIKNIDNTIEYGNGGFSEGPSSEPSHHFAYDSDDNWIYIAFQTDLTDYAFAGALIYEAYFYNNSGAEKYNYTGRTAEPVYDPDIVKPLTARFKEVYSALPSDAPNRFNPSRPVRVVKYNLSRRAEADYGGEKPYLYLYITPLDILDWPKTDDSDVITNALTKPDDGDLFEGGPSTDRISYPFSVGVWYAK
jgi:hypothetical protein